MQTILSQQPNQGEPEKGPETQSKTRTINFAKIIEGLYGVLLLLLPVFFLPVTADAFNINKTYLVLFIAVISLILFFLQAWRKGSLHLHGVVSYIPALLLLAAAVASVALSINRNVSLFGRYGNYNTSLMYIVALMIILFVASNVRIKTTTLLKYFMVGVSLSTAFSFLAFYSVKLPLFGNVVPGYSLVGSFNGLLGLQVVAAITAFYMLATVTTSKIYIKAISMVTLVLTLTYMIIVMKYIAIALVVIGIVAIFLTSKIDTKPLGKVFGPLVFVIALLSLIHMLPATQESLGISTNVSVPRLTLTQSWLIAVSAMRDFPFTGTGIGSFVVDFSRYRPVSLNATPYWNFRFAYPFNDIFLWMSTAGLAGAIAIFAFFGLVIYNAKGVSKEKASAYLAAFLSIAVVVILLALGYNLTLYVLLFLLMGLVIQNKNTDTLAIQSKVASLIMMVISVLLLGALIWQATPKYQAQISFRNAFKTSDAGQRYTNIRQAIASDSEEDFYIREGIFTNLLIAKGIAQKQEITDQDRTYFQQLIAQAINDARVITELIDPFNVANWEARGIAYSSIMDISQGANQFAIQAYTNAINLEPTNPRLWVDLGGIYYRMGDYQNAVARFARAIQLKPDYANAYYNLAFTLRDAGAYQAAVTQLEIVERLIPENDPAYAQVQRNLEEFRALAEQQAQAIADQQAQQAQQEILEDVPEEPDPFPDRAEELEEPLENPEEEGEYDINEEGVEVPDEVLNPELEEGEETEETTEAPADGTEVDEDQGETEAPIANPPEGE